MKIDKKVIENLEHISKIEAKVLLKSDEIAVAREDRNAIVYWKWNQNVSDKYGIYDMNHLLSVIKLHDMESIQVGVDNNRLKISSSNGENQYTYVSDDLEDIFVIAPSSEKFFEKLSSEQPVEFKMSESMINMIKKQQSVLGSPHLTFEGTEIVLTDEHDPSVNKFRKEIDVTDTIEKSVIIATASSGGGVFTSIKSSDYIVKVYGKAVIFEDENDDLTYVFAKIAT